MSVKEVADTNMPTIFFQTNEEVCVELFGKKLRIPLPRIWSQGNITKEFYFGFSVDNKGDPWYKVQAWEKDKRHLSLAELTEIFSCKTELTEIITAGIMLSTLQSLHDGIWTSDGLRREEDQLIISKNIDHNVEDIVCSYDVTYGYHLLNDFPSQTFSLERLFRKYVSFDNSPIKVPLKDIEKSNPDIIDCLFCQEYEKLPEVIQTADFLLPPNYLEQKKQPEWEMVNIWPVHINLKFVYYNNDLYKNSFRRKKVCINGGGICNQSILVHELRET